MKSFYGFFGVCLLASTLSRPAPLCATEVSLPPVSTNQATYQDIQLSNLQVQEQLHAVQLALEQNRKDAQDAATRSAETLGERLRGIETALAAQRARELEAMQSSNRVMLTVAGTFAAVGFVAMLLMAYFQWRTVTGLAQISSALPSVGALALGPGTRGDAQLLSAGAAASFSSQRLLGTLEEVEKRLLQLEHNTQATGLPPGSRSVDTGTAGQERPPANSNGSRPLADRIDNLLSQGDALLNQANPEEALASFDQALALEPQHAEALVKRGIALERLQRLDEAIASYDRAIAANQSLTIAYLHKGGLFNRMEKFNEALECYERALRSHEQPAA